MVEFNPYFTAQDDSGEKQDTLASSTGVKPRQSDSPG